MDRKRDFEGWRRHQFLLIAHLIGIKTTERRQRHNFSQPKHQKHIALRNRQHGAVHATGHCGYFGNL